MVKPIETVLRSGLFGPWDRPDIAGLDPAARRRLNPARSPTWGVDSFVLFPNFMLLVWAPGWYLTYHYWPTSYNRHIFEGTLYFVPPKNATERLRQELAAVTFKEYALQDGNTLEATQSMIESRAVTEFPLERPGDPPPPPAQDGPRVRRRPREVRDVGRPPMPRR